MKSVGLLTFLRGSSDPKAKMPGCANYDHHYGGCVFDKTCLVEDRKRCGYFEKSVLPTAVEIGLRDNLYKLYAKQIDIKEQLIQKPEDVRKCTCGTPLLPRYRMCPKCSQKARQETYRNKRKPKLSDAPQLT